MTSAPFAASQTRAVPSAQQAPNPTTATEVRQYFAKDGLDEYHRLTGTLAKGVPLAVPVALTAKDSTGRVAGRLVTVLIDVPVGILAEAILVGNVRQGAPLTQRCQEVLVARLMHGQEEEAPGVIDPCPRVHWLMIDAAAIPALLHPQPVDAEGRIRAIHPSTPGPVVRYSGSRLSLTTMSR